MKGKVSEFGGALGKGIEHAAHKVAQGTQKVLVEPAKAVAHQTHQGAIQPLQNAVTKGTNKVVVAPAKAMVNQVNQVAHKMAQGTQDVVVTPTKAAVQQTSKQIKAMGGAVAQSAKTLVSPSSKNSHKTPEVPLLSPSSNDKTMALPADEQMSQMDVLFTKQLANLSPNDWFTNFWSNLECYQEYYRDCNKQDIVISAWEEGDAISNPHDNENYTHRRTVQFHFEKNIMGRNLSPQVSMVEHARVTNDKNRCVVTSSTNCTGVPFGDAFQVQLRWVATRVGDSDLLLQLGLYIMFSKSVLVAGQIKSAARSESMEAQQKMFDAMKEACGVQESTTTVAATTAAAVVQEENRWNTAAVKESGSVCNMASLNIFRICAPTAPPERVFQDDLDRALCEVRDLLKTLGNSPLVEEQRTDVHAALATVEEALDGVLVRKLDLEDTTRTSTEEKVDSKSSLFKTSMVKSISSPVEQMNSVFVRRVKKTSKRARDVTLSPFLKSKDNKKTKDQSTERIDPALDEGLQSMDLVVSKYFYNTTLDDFHDALFSRPKTPRAETLYERWLRSCGALEVKVEKWDELWGDKCFMDPWSKERYQQKRVISFQSLRSSTSFLSEADSPALLNVKQTQYYRRETNKLVFANTEETTGAFYSKSMKTFRRVVVTQVEEKKLTFKAGIFVMFLRPVLSSSKIRAKETQESRRRYTELFRVTRASQTGEGDSKSSLKEKFEFKGIEEEGLSFFSGLTEKFRGAFRLSSAPLFQEDSEFKSKIKTIRGKLKMVDEVLDDREANSLEDLNFFSGQLLIAREVLDSVVTPSL